LFLCHTAGAWPCLPSSCYEPPWPRRVGPVCPQHCVNPQHCAPVCHKQCTLVDRFLFNWDAARFAPDVSPRSCADSALTVALSSASSVAVSGAEISVARTWALGCIIGGSKFKVLASFDSCVLQGDNVLLIHEYCQMLISFLPTVLVLSHSSELVNRRLVPLPS
jgi:hypothetical protein